MYQKRLLRARVLEALERRARQFRSRQDTHPFRVPHAPLALDDLVREALADDGGHLDEEDLKARSIINLHWQDGAEWAAWVVSLPSGVHMYCDSVAHETRVLATLKRGSSLEGDHFFLELLAESAGHAFGIEMTGGVPDRIRTPLTDREFLTDVFVEMYEGTEAQAAIHRAEHPPLGGMDFRADVGRWLDRVLASPPHVRPRRRVRRLRDEE